MKKKIICAIIIALSFVLMCSSISINDITIKNARERVLTELYTEEEPAEQQAEEMPEEELAEGEGGEVIEEDETNSFNSKELTIIIVSSVIFAISFITVIFTTMFLFNAIKLPISTKVLVIYTLFVIILSEVIIISTINYADKKYLNGTSFEVEALKKEQSLYVVNESTEEANVSLNGENNNETVFKITNESTYSATNLNLTKLKGTISDVKDNEDKGINNVLVINKGSLVSIKDSTITSKTNNSAAIYTTGLNTIVELDNVTINTTKNNSPALISKDSSETTIKNSELTTTGNNSPIFKVESTINADNITATTNSQIANVYNSNVLSIINSNITAKLSEEKNSLFTIEQTTKNNGSYDAASLTLENTKIKLDSKSKNYKTTSMFYVYNTNSQINLTNTKLTYGAKKLLDIISEESSSEKITTLTITDSSIKGSVTADKFSKLRFNINNSIYTGSINSKSKLKNVDITFDKTSTWNLTGHSYVNTITFQNQNNIRKYINSNGYNIYCNAKNNEWLGNKTITLPGGGKLIPIS